MNLAETVYAGFRPMMSNIQSPLNIDLLPVIPVDTYMIYSAPDIALRFNMNQFITFFDNQFIAIWTQGTNEGNSGNHIVCSTSPDGITWAPVQDVTPVAETGWTEGSAGLWEREGELWALYRHAEVGTRPEGPTYYGPSLALRGNRWNGSGWDQYQVICDNCHLDLQPIKLRTGKWYATGRDKHFRTQMILGDIGDWTRIIVPSPEGVLLNEATILPIGDGSILSYEYRNEMDMNPRVLLRSFSTNDGGTISPPLPTNFRDAAGRRAVMRLSDGRYILSSNASVPWGRRKLMLSVSDDGLTYNRMYILRGEETHPKWGWEPPDPPLHREGYQYPQFLERDGYLWVIYSRNKEDIEISRVELSAFE
ncbi:sialidase family protein [Nitratireductor luteus]|uniref:sialidase family protein n=1 Tax=Nitratireductor luteus TaxID=2976980 RepID=UPI00223E9C92|nr:sialidase family protein [Nitratireductor luteus]